MGLKIIGRFQLDGGLLFSRQARVQAVGDTQRDFGFDGKYVLEITVPGACPDLILTASVDHLDTDPHPPAGFLNAAGQQVGDTELAGHFANIDRQTGVSRRRTARDKPQVTDTGQAGHDLILNPAGEKGIVGIGAQALERQHRNALVIDCRV
ncbi:MAG TPA: hypothetical protein VK972_02770 [Wenzhouxiangella sp.]|nr:hypothetical protein [Wenzhouxiangella sp.]